MSHRHERYVAGVKNSHGYLDDPPGSGGLPIPRELERDLFELLKGDRAIRGSYVIRELTPAEQLEHLAEYLHSLGPARWYRR